MAISERSEDAEEGEEGGELPWGGKEDMVIACASLKKGFAAGKGSEGVDGQTNDLRREGHRFVVSEWRQ